MDVNGVSIKQTKNLIAYFALAYALSWSIGIPLALANQAIIEPILPAWAHYFVAYGPMLSALIVTRISEGRSGLSDFYSRIVRSKAPPIWWVAAVSPLVLGFLAALILNTSTGSEITLSSLGVVQFLPPLGIGALVLWILTYGIGEEIGWRGYALPRLQKGRSALVASVILWVLWAFWHLPAFFYLFDPSMAIGWGLGLFAGTIVFTWLFNSSRGNILILAIWHGCFNFITSPDAGDGLLAAVVSAIIMVWALAVVVIFKPRTLSHQNKVEI